jgi:hypothetical protein
MPGGLLWIDYQLNRLELRAHSGWQSFLTRWSKRTI